jgi:glycosyltransferase involved in cell wall biosynthesis
MTATNTPRRNGNGPAGDAPVPVSAIVLARNEEQNLPRCLRALRSCDEIIVVDDDSTDRTVALAESCGARVVAHKLASFAEQRNWAMQEAGARNEWVLHLDADEVVTAELAAEIRERLAQVAADVAGFHLARKTMLGEQWLRFSATYPVYVLRLVRRERVRYVQQGHGEKPGEVQGRLEYLRAACLHYNFSHGWSDWFDRHNRYSSAEAAHVQAGGATADLRGCLARDVVRRRMALRGLAYRLPCRPALRFFYVYLLRFGFLDGRAGLTYATLQAIYEYMISLKLREARNGGGLPRGN